MFNDHGQSIQEATPAVPVEITGFDDVPTTETFIVMDDERRLTTDAQRLENQRKPMFLSSRKRIWKTSSVNWKRLAVWNSTTAEGRRSGFCRGSAQLSLATAMKISVRFLHTGLGNVTETDVVLASASNAIIIAFNVQADAKARETLAREGVDLRLYDVITTLSTMFVRPCKACSLQRYVKK